MCEPKEIILATRIVNNKYVVYNESFGQLLFTITKQRINRVEESK